MGKRYTLRDYLKGKGADPESVIVPLVNEGGQEHAAKEAGVSQATISRFLKEHGYIPKVIYVKVAQPC